MTKEQMMKIGVRHYDKYTEVKVSDGRATMETGFMDDSERDEIVSEMMCAIEDLSPKGTSLSEWWLNKLADRGMDFVAEQ